MILLDTHAWVWWLAQPESLSEQARTAVQRGMEDGGLAVSSISVWELALLVQKGRLGLSIEVSRWLERCETLPFLSFLPVDDRVALHAVSLPPTLHADPADRMIVATALIHGMSVVTKDARIHTCGLVPAIW
ncbi:MAG: type II toxin-antitoxin system VapC family toxin [Actinobacteria bacterium]|nr:type II toxin-antitoxin system VapC family toxin [Actinomycetota bacterium]